MSAYADRGTVKVMKGHDEGMRETANTTEKKQKPLRVVMIAAALSFFGVLTETSMNVTFPTLEKTFGVSVGTVQWVTSGYLLSSSLIMLTSAFMKRRFTNRTLFIWAACLYLLGDVLCGTASWFPQLLLGRLIQAGCVGLCTPLMVNIILDVVPRARLGTYLGIANLIILIAPALGPTFGGAIVAFANWRMIFWLTVPPVLLLLLLGPRYFQQHTKTGPYAFDWARFALLAISLGGLLIGLNELGSGNWPRTLILFVISGLALWWFIRRSRTSTRHLFQLTVFKQPAFLYSWAIYLGMQFANVGLNVLLPNYVQVVFGASALLGGLVLLPGSVFNGFGQPFYGWLLDRFGGKLPLYLGDCLFTGALLAMALWGEAGGVIGMTVIYLVFAIGRSMGFSNASAYGLKHLPKNYQNDANALYNTGQQISGAIGTTVLSLVMSAIHRPGWTRAQDVAAGSKIAFAVLVLLGLGVAWLIHQLLSKTTAR